MGLIMLLQVLESVVNIAQVTKISRAGSSGASASPRRLVSPEKSSIWAPRAFGGLYHLYFPARQLSNPLDHDRSSRGSPSAQSVCTN